MRAWWLRVGSAMVFVWALASAITGWQAAIVRDANPVTALEVEFRTLAGVAPPSGAVGYLQPDHDAESVENTMTYYVAQYAFAPRLLVQRTDPEYLLVPDNAVRTSADERLAGFDLVASSTSGHRLYRRHAR